MSNIHDVAKRAGVSVATVSRVLNNSSLVGPETKNKVEQAVKELEYKTPRTSKYNRNGNNKTVLVLIPDISNHFYATVVKGIGDLALKTGCRLLLCNTSSSVMSESKYIEMLYSHAADGAIFLASELTKEELTNIDRRFHIVQCCEYDEDAAVSHVSINNLTAAYTAVQHLINLGHVRIGMISCDNKFLSTKQREASYIQSLRNNGLEVHPEYMIKADSYEFKSGFRAMNQLLLLSEPPTAVFAISDLMAIGAIQSATKAGLNVPEDVAIMGFDDIEFASMYKPSITTIYQPQYDLGYTSLDLLIKKMNGEVTGPRFIYLEHELRIRESTIK